MHEASQEVAIVNEQGLHARPIMQFVDLASREEFRTLLRATLVKKAEDIPSFERLFDLYFKAFQIPEDQLPSPVEQSGMSEPLQEILEQMNGLISPWLKRLALEGLPALAAALMEAADRAGLQGIQYPMQTAHFAQKMRNEFGAKIAGIVKKVSVAVGQSVERHTELCIVRPDEKDGPS